MAKVFDVYLNNRVTECDIVVYSIPYRDGLTVMEQMILESCIENYSLQKLLAMQGNDLELVSHIDKMIKYCCERLHTSTEVALDASFKVKNVLYPEISPIMLSCERADILARSFNSINNEICVASEKFRATLQKCLRPVVANADLVLEVQETLKQTLMAVEDSLGLLFEATGALKKPVSPELETLELGMEATAIVRRYRLLSELDPNPLSTYDGCTLDDVDYVVLQGGE